MPRALRIEYPGAIYGMNHGDRTTPLEEKSIATESVSIVRTDPFMRFLDFALKQGSKLIKLEVKYNLPKSGPQLTRLAAQVNESVGAGDGGTTVVWSLRPPPPATVQAVQQELGANYSKVVFKSGIGDLLTYLKTFF